MSAPLSQLLTQVPYSTQLPHSRVSNDVQTPVVTNLGQLIDELRTNSSCKVSEVVEQLAQTNRKTNDQPILQPTTNSSARDEDVQETNMHAFSSSGQSLDCQPFQQPQPNDTRSEEGGQEDSYSLARPGRQTLQPFPLVEWIKRIRKETPARGSTVPLRWAKRIPSDQLSILESDDAWSPSLAGNPYRPGTVPVEILNKLTTRADRKAEQTTSHSQHGPKKSLPVNERELGVGHNERKQVLTPAKRHSSPDPPTTTSSHGNHTIDASQWSSSPPQQNRLRAPPDTSPVRPQHVQPRTTESHRPPTQEEPEEPKEPEISDVEDEAENLPNPVSVHNVSTPGETDSGKGRSKLSQKLTHRSPPSLTPSEARSNTQMEQPRLIRTHAPSSQSNQQDTTAPPPRRPEIHVKDTPYPMRTASRDQSAAVNLPHSSFVGATYPDEGSLQPESSIRKRTSTVAFQDEDSSEDSQDVAGVPEKTPRLKKPKLVTGPTTPSVGASGMGKHAPLESSLRQRQEVENDKISSPRRYDDPAFWAYDDKRYLRRTMFRQSIATKVTKVRLEDHTAPSEGRHSVSKIASSDIASSPALSRNESRTSATNFSVHDFDETRASVSRFNSQRSTTSMNMNMFLSSKLFGIFVKTYTSYPGTEKSFNHAMKLLLQLRSKAIEPHPSLWDDFIYHFADKYDRHLEWCRQEYENALPYQDFYHLHVKRPEWTHEIITDETLRQLTETSINAPDDMNTPPLSDSIDSRKVANEDQHVIMHDKPVLNFDKSHPQTPGPTTQEAPFAPSSQLERSTKSRRSLPWSKGSLPQHSPIRGTQAINPQAQLQLSNKSKASSKVENWLRTSREADTTPSTAAVAKPLTQIDTLMGEANKEPGFSSQHTRLSVVEVPTSQSSELDETSSQEVPVNEPKNTVFSDFAKHYLELSSEKATLQDIFQGGRKAVNPYRW